MPSANADAFVGRCLPRDAAPAFADSHVVRVVMGPQDDAFTSDGIRTFLSAPFVMTPQSDRVGCRLAGPPVAHRRAADIVSDGTVCGAVQVGGDGMPIVLMADRGTTGGYTKIATVATADVWQLAQAAPGEEVRFVEVSVEEAQKLLREQQETLARIGCEAPRPAPAGGIFEEDSGSSLAAPAYADLADALSSCRPSGPRED
jgi:allophanate hydrolase subunit 2